MHESFEYTPGAALAPYVERAVGYLHAGLPAGVHVGMPSSSLTLVVPLDAPLVLSEGAHDSATPYASVVAGLCTDPTHIHHDGYQHGIQLALRPAAARVLLGCRPEEIAGRSFEWSDVFGREATALRERLHEVPGWGDRFALLEKVLVDRLRDTEGPPPEVSEAWRLVHASGGALPVHEVARRVGWSRRNLEQRFRREYGLTPKAAARVRRFERSVALVRLSRRRLADVAAACGFADQAHLAREWRDLAGRPPSRWRAEDVLAFDDESSDGVNEPGVVGRPTVRRAREDPRARQEEEA